MKRSDILYRVLLVIVVVIMIGAFTLPQEVLDRSEVFIFWIVFPLVGWLWIQAYVDSARDR